MSSATSRNGGECNHRFVIGEVPSTINIMRNLLLSIVLLPAVLLAVEPADTVTTEIRTTRPTAVVTQLNLPKRGRSVHKAILAPALLVRKTQALYWESGVGVDYTHDRLFGRRLHLNAGYLTSRLGSALGTNALKQDYFLLGADWHTPVADRLKWLAGIHTGFFSVDYEDEVFANLPASSALLSIETGLNYTAGPVDLQLVAGYNLIAGNGADVPGSLFPVYYQLMVKLPFELRK